MDENNLYKEMDEMGDNDEIDIPEVKSIYDVTVDWGEIPEDVIKQISWRADNVMLWVTTPHPLPTWHAWFKWTRWWLKVLMGVRYLIGKAFDALDENIETYNVDPILNEINNETIRITEYTSEFRLAHNINVSNINSLLDYWAKWQVDNL